MFPLQFRSATRLQLNSWSRVAVAAAWRRQATTCAAFGDKQGPRLPLSNSELLYDKGQNSRGAAVILHRVILGALGAAALVGCAAGLSRAEAARPAVPPPPAARMVDKQPLPSADYLSPDELSTIRLFQENTPAVVNVSNIIAARLPFSTDVLKLPQGQGSGFIWDTEGHIVTNHHVVRGAAELRIVLLDQSMYKARVVGADPAKDVAVLQLDAPKEVMKSLKPVSLGHSSGLMVGQKVLAIGNPFGLDHTLTSGIVSGLNRELPTWNGSIGLRNCIQIDAAVNPGNSGGPLLDSRGRLIGINTAIADPSGRGANSGVGFAIPIDSVKGLVQQILKYGRVVRPVLGVVLAPPQVVRQLGLEGVLVLGVSPGSPAGKAGMVGMSRDAFGRLVVGDVIIKMNERVIIKEGDLYNVLDSCAVGETVEVVVLRRGREQKVFHVVLAERAPEPAE